MYNVHACIPIYSLLHSDTFSHRFNCWYGTLGILDKLHKTDRPFTESIQGKRHFISFSLTPVSKLHPDRADGRAKPSCSAKVE